MSGLRLVFFTALALNSGCPDAAEGTAITQIGRKAPTGPTLPMQIRVLSYNIHHGLGVDGKLDLSRIAEVIRAAKPDIVALQEVDRKVDRSNNVDQPRELARRLKMDVRFIRNITLGRGEYGNAVLSRLRISSTRHHKLPNVRNGEQRGVLDVRFEVPGGLRLLATHFDHRRDHEERIKSARAIIGLRAADPATPTILAGDLNDTPSGPALQLLSKHWPLNRKPQATVPVERPKRQIDFVLAAPQNRWRVIQTRVLKNAVASDHRAILSILELKKPARGLSSPPKNTNARADQPSISACVRHTGENRTSFVNNADLHDAVPVVGSIVQVRVKASSVRCPLLHSVGNDSARLFTSFSLGDKRRRRTRGVPSGRTTCRDRSTI